MNQQFQIFHDFENFNNNYVFNLFPYTKIFEPEYTKENQTPKFFQEKNDLLNQKFNSEFIINDSSPLGSANETTPSQAKNNTFINSPIIDDSSQEKTKNTPLFQIDEIENSKELGDRLLMNRLSARKSRLKKKQYIKNMEEEIARLKNQMVLNQNINVNSNNFFNLNLKEENSSKKNELFLIKINLLEKQEKEVKNVGQKKSQNIMNQYESFQKTILREMLVKQIHFFIPLRYQIYGEKFIKLIEIYEDDSITVIIKKVEENLEKIKNYMNIVPKNRIKLVIKFHEIYKKLENYVNNFQILFKESFK